MQKIDMARIGPSKATRPERVVRMFLVRNRIPHKCNVKGLPGTPDIVIERSRTAVFVDGRFWHCSNSKARLISDFWKNKIDANVRRDRRKRRELRSIGYSILRIWDSDLRRRGWQARLLRSVGRSVGP